MSIMFDASNPWSLIALSATVVAGFLTNFFWARLTTLLPSFANNRAQNLSGIWLAKVRYANVPGRKGYDVIRIKEQFGSLYIYKEHYNSNLYYPAKVRGAGIFRGGMVSAYYYQEEKNAFTSGTMTFKQSDTDYGPAVLVGVYTQIIDREGEEKGPLMEPYNLIRITIPFWQQTKRLFGRTYFKNFGHVENFVARIDPRITKYLQNSW
jgi:hypothetical protein